MVKLVRKSIFPLPNNQMEESTFDFEIRAIQCPIYCVQVMERELFSNAFWCRIVPGSPNNNCRTTVKVVCCAILSHFIAGKMKCNYYNRSSLRGCVATIISLVLTNEMTVIHCYECIQMTVTRRNDFIIGEE